MLQGFSPAFRVTLAFALGVTLTASAQTPDPARAAQLYKEGQDLLAAIDPVHAMQKFLDAAQRGNAEAENEIGKLYYLGNGVDQSSNEATYWFNRSAQNGSLHGMANLGLMYFGDRGMPADYDKVAQWLPKPAEAGIAVAQCGLGMLYARGHGVEQDFAKALDLFTKAAEQGDTDAKNELGKLYLFGRGVKQNSQKAFDYFQQAARKNNVFAIINLGLMYLGDLGVPQDYSKAYSCFGTAAAKGQPIAQYQLAMLYENGNGVPKDRAKAFQLHLMAAQQGHPQAQIAVGDSYNGGDDDAGVESDLDAAVEWYKAAVQSHDPQVLADVAARFLDPESEIFDVDVARPLLVESANAGNAFGEYELAEAYWIEDKNFGKAIEWYKASAQQGFVLAMNELADIYFKSEVVTRNAQEAYVWAALAVDRGSSWLSGTRDKAAKELTADQLEAAKAIIEKKKAAWTLK